MKWFQKMELSRAEKGRLGSREFHKCGKLLKQKCLIELFWEMVCRNLKLYPERVLEELKEM